MTEFAFCIAENVIEKLEALSYLGISLTPNINSDLRKLEDTMLSLRAVLPYAEGRQATNHELTIWLGRLKDVFYDAIDVLDEFECEDLRRQVVKTHGSTDKKVGRFFSSSNRHDFRFKMGLRIKEIREKLEELAMDRAQFYLEERLDDKPIVQREMTYSFVHDSDVIGRDEDKEKIIDLLMHPCDDGTLPVISIVGIGGIGKTTLAQLVYSDERVANFFDIRSWVWVSEEFTVLKLAKEILKYVGGEISENMSMDEVQVSLRKILEKKKFLIVLDAVWNEDRDKWIGLKNLLMEGANGSKIVVTTRSHKVAVVMAPGPIHELKGLPDDDCWSLLLKQAFKEGEEQKDPKKVEIGKQIVKKCSGVPFAVKTLGHLLCFKTNEREWIFIRDNELWKLQQFADQILDSLRLSYNQLPSNLKQCFACFSLYPKDFTYSSKEVFQSWMASGLLQKFNKSTRDLEEIGQQYLNELLARSFIQEIEEYSDVLLFKMHGLLHDLSLYVAQNDYYCLIDNNNTHINFEKARHVSIWGKNLGPDEATRFLHQLSNNVRTIIFRGDRNQVININKSFVETCISRFKHLRLLDLSYSTLEALPSSIGALKHLRYLNLEENTHIKKLPNSICDLQNLETLLLRGCNELEELPRDIRKMVSIKYFEITTKQTCLPTNEIMSMCSLRDLLFYKCHSLVALPQWLPNLTSLQKLQIGDCPKLSSLPEGMGRLTTLRELKINHCGELSKNCEREVGVEWPKIKHIPQIEITQ